MARFRVGILDDDNSKIVEIVDNLKYAFESIPEYGEYSFDPIEISINSDIEETVAAIIDQHIECMLIDYNLSSRKTAGYNGVEVARRVWSFRKNLPVFLLTSFDEDVYTHELFSAFQIFNYARYQNNTEEQLDIHKKIVREIEFHKKRVAAWERELMELLERRGESAEIDARILELDSELESDLDTYSSLSMKTKRDLSGSALLSLVKKLDLFLERNT